MNNVRLIDANALRAAVEEPLYHSTIPDYGEVIRVDKVMEFIDKAASFEQHDGQCISSIPKDYLYDTETAEFYVYRNKYTGKEIHIAKNPPTYVLDTRSKGSWKLIEKDNQDIDVVCPFCNSIRFPAYSHGYTVEELEKQLIRQHLPNFCEDCGADMRGGDVT